MWEVVERVGRRCTLLENAEVLIQESDSVGAYVELAKSGRVTVTRGALERLTREELEAALAHECGHLLHQVDALLLAIPLTTFLLPIVYLPLDVGLAVLGGADPPGLFLSTVLAVSILLAEFILSVHYRMLVEVLADLKSVEITGSDALASVLAKIEEFNKPVDIEGLLKKHLGRKLALLYPVVKAYITITNAYPPVQLRIHVIKEYHQRIFETRSLTT